MPNSNDLPLRTIKTLIFLIVKQRGEAIMSHFSLIENKDESELSYYVQKSLRQCEQTHNNGKNNRNTSNVSSSSQALVSEQSTPRSSLNGLSPLIVRNGASLTNGDENLAPNQLNGRFSTSAANAQGNYRL
jgi:hypothetical protein